MRRYLLIIGLMSLSFAILSSCGMAEVSDNGDLDGFWHLERVDTLNTGGVCLLDEDRRFWGIQYDLLNFRDADRKVDNLYMRFSHEKGVLRLYHPYVYKWGGEEGHERVNDWPIQDDFSSLAPFGIRQAEELFEIETLNHSKMVLKSSSLRLYFRKF